MTGSRSHLVTVAILLTQTLAFTQQPSTSKHGHAEGIVGDIPGGAPGMATCPFGHLRVPARVIERRLIERVQPKYPDEARRRRVEGTVVTCAVIDTKGNVEELKLISGHPLLAPAALDAIRHWRYKPYLLNGKPVKIETLASVSFTLAEN